jgi:hypothetical protein
MKLKDVKLRPGSRAEIVGMAMAEEGLLGADPRDYAVLRGCSLLTLFGEYWVISRLDGRDVDPRNVTGDGAIEAGAERAVVHRRDLWRVIGTEEARKFWRFGRRTRK